MLQADGGTRTAAITGAYVALHQALAGLVRSELVPELPVESAVAAVSAGIVDGGVLLDLCYEEDARADADFNVVMTDQAEIVEVQGTAEGQTFSRAALGEVLDVAEQGIEELLRAQRRAIAGF